MTKNPVLFKSKSLSIGFVKKPHEMDRSELSHELSCRLEREKMYQEEANEREVLIYELELHQLELEIQNRELIESQKYLEASKNKYLELYDSAPVGYASLDLKGKILEVNFTTAKILKKEKNNIIGKNLSSWIGKDDKRLFSLHLQDCISGQDCEKHIIQIELNIPGSREPLFVEFRSTLSTDVHQDKKVINLAMIDITESRKVLALESKTKELFDEKKLRENFVATLSHDLRTPLTSSKLCAQLLDGKLIDINKQKKLYQLMIEELDRADRMIKELLDANRIKGSEGLPVIKKNCNLSNLALRCIENISQLHPEINIDFRIDENVTGLWSKDALHRIIENLIYNAQKYGSKTTPITLSVEKKNNFAYLVIHNFGEPISKRDQKRIFEAFHRCELKSEKIVCGWGLGLNLVNNLVRRHNGEIKVQSSLREGTSFTVILPIK